MSRRRTAAKREIAQDPKYNSVIVAKFINTLMKKGKRSVSQSILYGALDIVAQKSQEDPLELFQRALDNVKPVLEVRSRRVGGSTYQVPTEVRAARRNALGIRWLIGFAKARGEKTMAAKLAGELLDAAGNRGAAIKKREDTHKMAEANKAFAHYRF